jgi:hypothetical protein
VTSGVRDILFGVIFPQHCDDGPERLITVIPLSFQELNPLKEKVGGLERELRTTAEHLQGRIDEEEEARKDDVQRILERLTR